MSSAATQEVLAPTDGLGLSDQEHKWCLEFLVDFDAANAAKRAGVTLKKCATYGVAMMRREDVRAHLNQLKQGMLLKANLSSEAILLELGKLGFSNMEDYITRQKDGSVVFDFTNVTRQQMAAVSELVVEEFLVGSGEEAREVRKTKLKLHSKREALVDLGKHFGVFKDEKLNFLFALVLSADEQNA